jgi:phenylacetate-CoA ligase
MLSWFPSLWPEDCLIEILEERNGMQLPLGEIGRMVSTGFLNPTMPLIRYDVGDRGRLQRKATVSVSASR